MLFIPGQLDLKTMGDGEPAILVINLIIES